MSKIVIPPQAIDAEQVILGNIINEPSKYSEASAIITTPDVFYDDTNKLLWKKLKGIIVRGKELDLVSLANELSEKEKNQGITPMYLADLTAKATEGQRIDVYAQILHKKYLMRKLIHEAYKIQSNAFEANGNAYDILNTTHTTISALLDMKPQQEFDIGDALHETIDSIQNSERNLIPIGYPALDKMSGGLTRGELTIIGGRPGHCKSTLSLNIMKNMIDRGYKCLLLNREMSNVEMLKKLVVLESGILSYSMVRSGACGDESQVNELERAVEQVRKKYNKDKFLMFDNIRDFNQASAEIKKFKPDVVFDDYLQLIVPDNKISERRLQLEKIVHEYKWLAKNVNCAAVLVSQLNRSLESRGNPTPRLSDLAESGAIEQAAENVFFTYYDYKIFKNKSLERGYGKDVIEVIAGKVRYGETGQVKMDYTGDKVKINEKVQNNPWD